MSSDEGARSPLAPQLAALRRAVSDLGREAQGYPAEPVIAAARRVEAEALKLARQVEVKSGQGLGTAAAVPAERLRVLVAEDDPAQLELLEEMLQPWFEVQTARNGSEAAHLLAEKLPDVLLTDLHMPDASGLDLIELVRVGAELTPIPVIVVSACGDTRSKLRAFECGAFDFVVKPFAPEELVARLRNALAHSQVLRRERLLGGRDDLTGLANRRAYRLFLERAVRTARAEGHAVTVMLVDQDRLKRINDTWGHFAGDEALKVLSSVLAANSRGSDCVARIGGDEFAVVMPACGRDGADRLRARVEDGLRRRPVSLPNGEGFMVEASFGIATLGEVDGEETADQLLRRADEDLYVHKRRWGVLRYSRAPSS